MLLPSGADDLTTEEQIQMMRAAAEEDERRARFLAHVHAHARAQQAFKMAQLAAAERENAKRTLNKKKRPIMASKKHRSSSASTKPSRM
jgi:DNA-binding phage protein